MTSNPRSQNGFLKSLSPDDFEAIRSHLRTIELSRGKILAGFGDPIEQVYFPHSCVLARIAELGAGESLEIFLIGPDSVLGALATAGVPETRTAAVVLLPGVASIIDIGRLRTAAAFSPTLSQELSRHGRAALAQVQQAVSCKTQHPLEKRLARWLLRVRDLAGSNRFMMSEQTIAQMIGARSNSISIVARSLQHSNYIKFGRGHIEITDPEGLAKTACTCYTATKMQDADLQQPVDETFLGDAKLVSNLIR
jgi:CRP-like cAMP-binding protein